MTTILHSRGNHLEEAAVWREMGEVVRRAGTVGTLALVEYQEAGNTILSDRGEYGLAERGAREVLEKRRASASTRLTAAAQGELAGTLVAQGRFQEAEQSCRTALGLLQNKDTINRAASYFTRLGHILLLENKRAEAREVLNKSIALLQPNVGPVHPVLVSASLDLGELDLAERHPDEAAKRFGQALTIRKKVMVPGAWEITVVESALARARGEASRSRTLLPALERCAPVSFDCRMELARVRTTLTPAAPASEPLQ